MKQVNAEIISLGTELLLGQIANTNAKWLSSELSTYGINLFHHTVVGDNISRVKDTFKIAQNRSELIIVTGGLGPTEDDMTRDAFQLMTNLNMYEDEQSLHKIKDYFKRLNRQMTPNNRKQALIFESAQVLENTSGMAPGMIVKYRDINWIFLPGVPREMKTIFREKVRPFLNEITNQKGIIKSKILRFIGIGEAELVHELSGLIQSQSNPTIAPLAEDNGIAIRLTVKTNTVVLANEKLQKIAQEILNRVGKYCYGTDDDTIETVIGKLLSQKKLTIAAAESITGGLFTSQLIAVKGASKLIPGGIVAYDTSVKQSVLGVSEKIIQTYGVVSEQCALHMAKKIKEKLNTNIGISFTGVAGPDRLDGYNVGTVFIGLVTDNDSAVYSYDFSGDRNQIRNRATMKGYELIYQLLK